MKISPKVRRISILSIWILVSVGVLVLLGFVDSRQEAAKCKGLFVTIDEAVDHDFVAENDIIELINSKGKVIDKPLGSINTSLLEKIVLTNPYVAKAEVYSSIDGNLHVDIVQRDPIVRIFNMKNEQFYIDNSGDFMPTSTLYTPPVLVANGFIFDTFAEMRIQQNTESIPDSLKINKIIDQVYALSSFIEKDSFWSSNIEQIYVNESQELELVPRIGSHIILMGDTTNMKDKFDRLMVFYKEGLSKTGWNNYKVINVKFRNQVVCSKIKS